MGFKQKEYSVPVSELCSKLEVGVPLNIRFASSFGDVLPRNYVFCPKASMYVLNVCMHLSIKGETATETPMYICERNQYRKQRQKREQNKSTKLRECM
jgi:hypothetical protein